MTEALLKLAIITGAHGIRGEVKVKPLTDSPETVGSCGPLSDKTGSRSFKLKITGNAGGQLIASIEGVADRNAAELLKNTELYAPRSALPAAKKPGSIIASDLMGLAVEMPDGQQLGKVWSLLNFGAGDILEVEHANGTALYPMTAVKKVDVAAGKVILEPPEEV